MQMLWVLCFEILEDLSLTWVPGTSYDSSTSSFQKLHTGGIESYRSLLRDMCARHAVHAVHDVKISAFKGPISWPWRMYPFEALQ